MEFIILIIIPCVGSWSLYSLLLFTVWGHGVYTPYYHSLCGVVEFILLIIIPCTGHGVYTPYYYSLCGDVEFILLIIIPCVGSWSLYSLLLFPVWCRGVCSWVNKETLLELPPPLTFLGFEPVTRCVQIAYSNQEATTAPYLFRLYPVDKTRVNEFGQSFEDETSTTTQGDGVQGKTKMEWSRRRVWVSSDDCRRV